MAPKTFEAEPTPAGDQEDLAELIRDQFSDQDIRLKKLIESVDDSAAGLRLELQATKRELLEMRAIQGRLQARIDNQLMAMILANLASGVGVAALMLAANSAF